MRAVLWAIVVLLASGCVQPTTWSDTMIVLERSVSAPAGTALVGAHCQTVEASVAEAEAKLLRADDARGPVIVHRLGKGFAGHDEDFHHIAGDLYTVPAAVRGAPPLGTLGVGAQTTWNGTAIPADHTLHITYQDGTVQEMIRIRTVHDARIRVIEPAGPCD